MAKTQALVKWDEELARRAQISKGMEDSVSLGSFMSIRGGALSYNGNRIEGDKIKVIVLAHVLENKYFDKKFDPDSPSSPACYAFGVLDKDLKPHEKAPKPQADKCAECEHNEWGSSSRGRGKACKNGRRLALLHVDALKDKDGVKNSTVLYLELPVTSVKGWASYVQGLAQVKKRPPSAVVTEISVTPDPKTQVKVSFKFVDDVPREQLGAVMERSDEMEKMIGFAYPTLEDEDTARRPQRKAGKKKSKFA